MKRIGNLLLGLILYGFVSLPCEATIYNSDGTSANVQYLHDHSAQLGDTITLPAGTFTWTAGVTLAKSIKLQGAGIGQTILRDAVQGIRLIKWDYRTTSNARPRLTGIEFRDGGRTRGGEGPGGVIHITGSSENGSRFRMDHCKAVDLNGVIVTADVLGVVDHSEFHNGIRTGNIFTVYNEHFANGTYSNGSWSAPSYFGTDKFLFFENDNFQNPSDNVSSIADGYKGARIVVRQCTLYHKQVQMHGTDMGSYPSRGARCAEVYNNTIVGIPSKNDVTMIRSGVWIIHNNSITGFDEPSFSLRCYRLWSDLRQQTFGGADGTNAFDVNATTNPAYSGVAANGNNGLSVTVQGANFTTDQWRGYQIKRTSNINNLSGPRFSEILHNTAHTITYAAGYGANLRFSAGDTFALRRVVQALDQPGRSGGNFVSANPPVASGANDQVTEPCYCWNNGRTVFFALDPVIRAGVHYHNNTVLPGYVPYVYPHPLVTN
jgi:hypothetical protein